MNESDKREVQRYQDLGILNVLSGVDYAFSPRIFGNMAFPYGEMAEVIASRKYFLQTVGMRLEDMVFMRPVHKVDVSVVGVKDKGKGAFDSSSAVLNSGCQVYPHFIAHLS